MAAVVSSQAVGVRAPVAAEAGGVPAADVAGLCGGLRGFGLGCGGRVRFCVGRLLGGGSLGLLVCVERLDVRNVER